MAVAEAVFLYTPFPYWGIFVLVLYWHDLSRLLHPFKDDGSLRRWWSVLYHLGLFDKERAPKKPGRRWILSFLVIVMVSTGTSLGWSLRLFPPLWYCLIIAQGISAIVLTGGTVWCLGAPPRRPYVDVLRYPRLGSRIRHLDVVPAAPRKSDSDTQDSTS